jgi:hypothetical protein
LGAEHQDYVINAGTLEYMERQGLPQAKVALLEARGGTYTLCDIHPLGSTTNFFPRGRVPKVLNLPWNEQWLLRYCARPIFSRERFKWVADDFNRLVYRLPKPTLATFI